MRALLKTVCRRTKYSSSSQKVTPGQRHTLFLKPSHRQFLGEQRLGQDTYVILRRYFSQPDPMSLNACR